MINIRCRHHVMALCYLGLRGDLLSAMAMLRTASSFEEMACRRRSLDSEWAWKRRMRSLRLSSTKRARANVAMSFAQYMVAST